MKKAIICFICLLTLFNSFAQQKDKRLEDAVSKMIGGFHGQMGVFVKSLKTGKAISINGDTVFPTASIVKVPILMGIMDKINRKELDYHQKLIDYQHHKDRITSPLKKIGNRFVSISWEQAINEIVDKLNNIDRTRILYMAPAIVEYKSVYKYELMRRLRSEEHTSELQSH